VTDKMTENLDELRTLQSALWQFNQATSLLSEIELGGDPIDEIKESVPVIREALRAFAQLDLGSLALTEGAREVDWCVVHNSKADGRWCEGFEIVRFFHEPESPCRMVPAKLWVGE
jgi:hypothetical protein